MNKPYQYVCVHRIDFEYIIINITGLLLHISYIYKF